MLNTSCIGKIVSAHRSGKQVFYHKMELEKRLMYEGYISLEEQQFLPKVVFGENPTLIRKEKTHVTGYKIKGISVPLSPSMIFARLPEVVYSTTEAINKIDMISLGNVYCYVLTKGNHVRYPERLTVEDIAFSNPYEALDLIRLMAYNKNDLTVEDVLKHPFHWNEMQKLLFIDRTCDFFNIRTKHRKSISMLLAQYSMIEAPDVIPKNWVERLKLTMVEIKTIRHKNELTPISTDMIYDICLQNNRKPETIYDLLCFIRRQYRFFHENTRPVKLAFGSCPIGLWNFFSLRFPKLFMHVYQNMKQCIVWGEQDIERFSGSHYDEPAALKSSKRAKQSIDTVYDYKKPTVKTVDVGVGTDRYSQLTSGFTRAALTAKTKDVGVGTDEYCKEDETSAEKFIDISRPSIVQFHPSKDKPVLSSSVYENESSFDEKFETNKSVDYMDLDHESLRRRRVKTTRIKTRRTRYDESFAKSILSDEVGNAYKKHEVHEDVPERINDAAESDVDDDFLEKFLQAISVTSKEEFCNCAWKGNHRTALEKLTNKEYQIETGSKLNIKYSNDIDVDQYKELGNLASTHCMSLRASCNITDKKIGSFLQGFKNRKLKELDISCSKFLTTTGFRIVARFAAIRGIKILKLGGCKLTKEHVHVLYTQLNGIASEELEELDMSYNPTLEPEDYDKVGKIVDECGVKKLRLAGCKLTECHLKNLRIGNSHEVDLFDMADNASIGSGITVAARIVREWKLKELNISDCMITKRNLKLFGGALKEATIRKLHLSDYNQSPDEAYIEEVRELLPFVTEVLYLRCKSINVSCRRTLQKEVDKLTERTTKISLMTECIMRQEANNETEV